MRSNTALEQDPTLEHFDLFILHLDADVAEYKYGDCGAIVVETGGAQLPLPCSRPCPPASDTVDELRKLVVQWLGLKQIGPRTVLCIPSKMTDAWLAAAILTRGHGLLANVECNLNLTIDLARLPKKERIRKNPVEYRQHASAITANWTHIATTCTEARRFEHAVHSALLAAAQP
jgi:hypothetical protein